MNEQLLQYAPPYLEGLQDLGQVLQVEGEALAALWESVAYTSDSFYVLTCPLETLEKYELLLGISPSGEESLEDRRARVVARLNNREKLSKAYLENLVRSFAWGDVDIRLVGKAIRLTALSRYGVLPQHEIVAQILREKLPAHLQGELIFKLWLYGEMAAEGVLYGFLERFSHEEITNRDLSSAGSNSPLSQYDTSGALGTRGGTT